MVWRPHWSEWFHYDVKLDLDVCRLSMADQHGREYFVIVPTAGRGYRDRRDQAVDALLDAMDKQEPGEVHVAFDVTA